MFVGGVIVTEFISVVVPESITVVFTKSVTLAFTEFTDPVSFDQ